MNLKGSGDHLDMGSEGEGSIKVEKFWRQMLVGGDRLGAEKSHAYKEQTGKGNEWKKLDWEYDREGLVCGNCPVC